MKDFVPTDALSASFFMRLFNKELEVNLRCDHVGEHHSQSTAAEIVCRGATLKNTLSSFGLTVFITRGVLKGDVSV